MLYNLIVLLLYLRYIYLVSDMKNNFAKLITGVAMISILLLQGMWLYNSYEFVGLEIKNKVNACLSESNEKEIFNRLNVALLEMPKGAIISSDTTSEKSTAFVPNYTDLQESLVKLGKPLMLHKLDTLFSKSLEKANIKVKYILNKINPETGEILETTDLKLRGKLDGALASDVIPINKNSTEGIQVLIVSPYKVIFERMTILLIGSIVMAIIIGYCIFFQIKMIIRQNKIAQMRQDFTYAMVHDMKTPLSTILMGISTLKSGKLDGKKEKTDKYFEICMDESNHLLTLTNRVLTIAKLEQSVLVLNKQIVNLKEIVNPLAEKFGVNSIKKVVFTISISEDANLVIADYEYLKEAISNLIDNAIKYSGEEADVNITCVKANDQISIVVEDKGLGIAPKDQAKIFEKFERAAAIGRKGGAAGFGLGLNYVLRVVEAHGGTVAVSSVKGEFSKFTINLPVLIEEI